MWLWASGILVLFLYVNPTVSKDVCSDGMIKGAILSLARIIRDNSERVDRYEAREHRLNENIRKGVEDLTKKMSGIDTYVGHFSRIEDRISRIEQLISQRDERERIQMQKTADSIENLETRLEAQLSEIENTISEVNQHVKRTESAKVTETVSSHIISRINDTEAHLLKKVGQIDSSLQTMVNKNKEELIAQTQKRDEKERIQSEKVGKLIESLENRLKTQLAEIKSTVKVIVDTTPAIPTVDCASASHIVSIVNDSKADILGKVAQIEASLGNVAINAHEAVSQTEKLQTLLNKRDAKESIQNQKTEKLIENSEDRIKTELDQIKSTINVIVNTTPPPQTIECALTSDVVSILNDTEAHLLKKAVEIESSLDAMASKNAHEAAVQAAKLQTIFNKRDVEQNIQNQKTEKLIENAENRIKTELDEIKSIIDVIVNTTPPPPTIECALTTDVVSILNDTEAHLLEKAAEIESSLDNMANKNAYEAAAQAAKLQTMFNKRDVEESVQNQKTEKLIENAENRIKTQLDEIKSIIDVIVNTTPPPPTIECASASDVVSILNDTEAHLLEKVVQIESSLDNMAVKNTKESIMQAEKLQTIFNERDVRKRIENEKIQELMATLVNRLQARPDEVDDDILTEIQNIGSRFGDIASSVEKVHRAIEKEGEKPEEPIVDIGAIFEAQTRALGKVTEFIENILNRIQDLPTTSELQALHNETQASLQETKHTLQSAVSDKIDGMVNNLVASDREIKNNIENVRSHLANNTEQVNKELHDLAAAQALTITTAQEVLDTKITVEYGVLQILSELRESMKNYGATINETLNNKIDGVSNDIIGNHRRAIANMTSRMEEELKQVWRQIMVMYKDITDNTATLNKLNQQNEAYVNRTTYTMDGMETKVGDITKRMGEVDDNLNYLLGRLSLVTQEFNQIKTGLGSALDNIKASFKDLEEKANGLNHPGRHRIPDDYRGDEDNSNIYTTANNLIGAA